jgi:3-oxoacyl-[acyl-carrier protein] reductase
MSRVPHPPSRRVLITGACGVYGRRFSRAFAASGAQLVLIDRDPASLTRLSQDLAPADVATFGIDLTQADEIRAAVETICDRQLVPDVIVNNAGMFPFGSFLETSVETWDQVMAVNLRASFLLSQLIAKAMIREARRGSIINIGSGSATLVRQNDVAYSVSKRGLDWLTKAMALELGRHGIRVNALVPGIAVGDSTDFPDGYVDTIASRIPIGRVGSEDDAAKALLFLASEEASYITGASLAVDGGSSIPRRFLPATN